MKDFLAKYIDGHKEEILKDLSDFIAIASVSSDSEKVEEALNFALKLGENMGFKAESCADGQVGVIEMGEGDEILGILTHVDVVPAGDREEWATDPFEAVIKDGRMYGRGTLDDKGMIIASLYAMKAAAELNLPLKKRVQLIMGTQEEVSWTDMEAYMKEYRLPDYGFTPDGEYPICNIEKGSLSVELVFPLDFQEDGSLQAVSVDCGIAANAVPGKASAVLSDGRTITAYGKGVHSCQPERGDNALFRLCDMLKEEGACENQLMRLMETVKDTFEDIFGSRLGLYSESEYYQGEFVHRNAFSPTMFHVRDGKAYVTINNRYPYGASYEEILEKLKDFAVKNGGELVEADNLPPVFVSKERKFLKLLAEAYEEVTGLKNEYTLAYGGSYAKAMPNVVSWGPIFPGEEDTCHEVNEYIGIDSLMASTKIFAQSVASIALSEESFL